MTEKVDCSEELKKRREFAVRKILLKKNLPPDMRLYWSMVMAHFDTWAGAIAMLHHDIDKFKADDLNP